MEPGLDNLFKLKIDWQYYIMKTNKIASNTNGFTLLEILITMVVATVVMSGAFMFYTKQQRQMLIQNEDG